MELTEIQSPGSFEQFKGQNPDISGPDLLSAYFDELAQHRNRLAESLGVTVVELHEREDRANMPANGRLEVAS